MNRSRIFFFCIIFLILYQNELNCLTFPLSKCCGGDDHVYQNGKCEHLRNLEESEISYSTLLNKFKLIEKLPACSQNELKSIETVSSSNGSTSAANSPLTLNGYFKHGDIYFPPEEYCINRITLNKTWTNISVLICEPECNDERPCFPKCCPPDQVLEFTSENKTKCTALASVSKFWLPKVYSEDLPRESPRFRVTGNIMSRKEEFYVIPKRNVSVFEKIDSRILKNGRVQINWQSDGKWTEPPPKAEFCIDGILTSEEENSNLIPNEFSGHEEDTAILWKIESESVTTTGERNIAREHIYKGAFFIASFFLFWNIIVYGALWKTRKSVYWLTQMSYFVSLFFMYIFLAAAFIRSPTERSTPNREVLSSTCLFIGILAHFFFLSSFCWMTMINLDMWSRLGRHENMVAASSGAVVGPKKFNKYFWYAGFAVGTPFIIVGIGGLLDALLEKYSYLTPDYGREKCYIQKCGVFPYLYAPIGLLLSANLIIYIATVISVIRFKRKGTNVSFASRQSNSSCGQESDGKKSLKLFAKLFLIMGVLWILEVVGWAYEPKHWIWHIIDIFNILQSVLIFFIFVCKADVIRELRGKYSWFDKLMRFLHVRMGELKNLGTVSGQTTRTNSVGFEKRTSGPRCLSSRQNSRNSDFSSSSTSTKSSALSDIAESCSYDGDSTDL